MLTVEQLHTGSLGFISQENSEITWKRIKAND